MAHCPYCGGELEEGGTRCDLCGEIPTGKGNDPLNDTAPFVPTYDAMEELRRTRKFTPEGDARKPALEEPTSPLPEHIQRALDDGAEVSEKATVVARPIPGRQLGRSGSSPGDHDTLSDPDAPGVGDSFPEEVRVTLPVRPDPEPADSLRATMMEGPAEGANMRATVVDAPIADRTGAPAESVHEALQDTLINVQSMSGLPSSGEQKRLDSITFSELNAEDSGAAPLDSSQFRRPENDPTATAPIRLPELDTDAVGEESAGGEVPLSNAERPAPLDPEVTGEQVVQARSGGLPWLCRLLCLLTGLLWLGVAALAAAPYLALPQLGQLLAWSPIYAEYIPTIPGGLTLICIMLAAAVRARIDRVTRDASWIGAFFKLLLVFVLVALPGIGALLGLIIGLIWLFKRRPAGGLLLLYTLGWHASLTLYFWVRALAYARAYLPFDL
jgi:hypothetical protein